MKPTHRQVELEEEDYQWLCNLIERARTKAKLDPHKYQVETRILFERVAEALTQATDIRKADEAPKEKKPKAAKPVPQKNHCKEHPSYQASRIPRKDCSGCWNLYVKLHPLEGERKRKEFLRRQKSAKS